MLVVLYILIVPVLILLELAHAGRSFYAPVARLDCRGFLCPCCDVPQARRTS